MLHAYMLHAPDFLGLQDAIQIAHTNPEEVERVLRMKKLGNQVMDLVGGRSIRPINYKVGGFYKAPSVKAARALIEPLKQAIEDCWKTVRLFATFEFPDYEDGYSVIALTHPDEYANNRGLVVELDEFFDRLKRQLLLGLSSRPAGRRRAASDAVV